MAERKRLSGAQYRKRRAKKFKEEIEREGSLLKYLCSSPHRDQDVPELNNQIQTEADTKAEEIKEVSETKDMYESQNEMHPDPATESAKSESSDSENLTGLYVNYGDPATWTKCDDHMRQILIQHGPEQVDQFDFPKDSMQRKFPKIHYNRRLVNGEEIRRHWLQYSVSNDSVYCFCCKLFTRSTIGASSLSDKGSNNWKNMSAILSGHEEGSEHIVNFQSWKELELRLQHMKTIDAEHLRVIKEKEHYWQQILKRLIALVRVLGMQNLAFRGTCEKLHTSGNGNFLKFLEFLALFDPLIGEHLRKITDNERHLHYLGKDIQNELILLLSNAIKQQILASARAAKYFSIILDCTPDAGNVEQMTIIIRFVDMISDPDSEIAAVTIKEHFLGFVPLKETTGAGMTETILRQLEQMSLSVANVRGQGYDNGSNMKGKENGVQRRILDINPRAFFVPCNAHTLNLVVNDAAKCCLEATAFFDLVQRVYVFFSASTRRWEVLNRHISKLTVKPLSETRWESRIDALKPLRYQLGDIYDALMEIADDTSLTGASGNTSRVDSRAIARAISSFKFVVSLVVWYDLLFEINITSKQLQAKKLDIHSAINQLRETKKFLVNRRNDAEFEKTLVDAAEIAGDLEIPTIFEPEPARIRRKKKQFAYEGDDEPIQPQDPKEKFKVNFYFAVLDTAIQSVEERFTLMQKISSMFGFLYDVHSLQNKTRIEIMEHCLNLEHALQHGDSKDIDAIDLCSELEAISRRVVRCSSPEDVLNFIFENKLTDSVPNIVIALRILLTLPVSVASGERSFSKLKLIKTYLRTSMLQERLVGLAFLSIEHDIARDIDLMELVSTFAKAKARKIKF